MEYLGKIWRGEVALWKVYWLWGGIGTAILSFLSIGVTYLLAANYTRLGDNGFAFLDNTRIGLVLAYTY